MPQSLNVIIAALPKGERAAIEARARELISKEMVSLRKRRASIRKTQRRITRRS